MLKMIPSGGVVKSLLFICNCLFLVAGVALIAFGIFFVADFHVYSDALHNEASTLLAAPITLIIIGFITCLVSILGCCGAVKEHPCLLTTYNWITIAILVIQVITSVLVFILISDDVKFKNTTRTELQLAFNQYQSGDVAIRDSFDVIQLGLKCCGVESFHDWDNVPGGIPNSCCESDVCKHNNSFEAGCVDKMFEYLNDFLTAIAIAVVAMGLPNILATITSCCLTHIVKTEEKNAIPTNSPIRRRV